MIEYLRQCCEGSVMRFWKRYKREMLLCAAVMVWAAIVLVAWTLWKYG
jgi:hypothetical protein